MRKTPRYTVGPCAYPYCKFSAHTGCVALRIGYLGTCTFRSAANAPFLCLSHLASNRNSVQGMAMHMEIFPRRISIQLHGHVGNGSVYDFQLYLRWWWGLR